MQIYQLKYNMLDNSISNKEPSEIVQETRHYLQDHYPIETSDVFRPPFYEEICAITQLAINLRKVGKPDDSLKLYAKCYDCFYKSRIDHAFQYKSFGIIQSNYAIQSNDYKIALDDISYLFDVGSLSDLYLSVGIIGCKLYNKDKTNEHAKKVIKASSSLAMLTMRFEDARKMENTLNHL